MLMKFFRNKLTLVLFFFGIIYSLISLVNHYCFRTYALDLGAYTNALYDYIHLQWNDSSVFKEVPENLLSDHFDLYLIIFSPFIYLFKTYTLLIIQIISVLVGAYGVYLYFMKQISSSNAQHIAILLTIAFLLFFGIYSALSYDYHSNVVASMLIPYFFLFIREKKWLLSFLILFFICIAKESMPLIMSFVILGLLLEYFKDALRRKYLFVFIVFCVSYFLIVTQFLMPYFSNDGKFYQFKYSILGSNFSSAIIHILQHPLDTLKYLFINHTNNPKADFVKAELHIFVLLSGLWLLFFKPNYLLMLLPVYFQKMYHDNYLTWGIDHQYSVEFAPIIIIGAGEFIINQRNYTTQRIISIILILLNLSVTIRLMDRTILFTNKSRIRIYQSSHYQRNFDIKNVYSAISIIPNDAIVSAQTSILPHLALRDKIYCFPIIKDAEYIILNTKDDTYPLDTAGYKIKVNQLLQDTAQWKILFDKQSVVVLGRKK